jgi:hypothetical protein
VPIALEIACPEVSTGEGLADVDPYTSVVELDKELAIPSSLEVASPDDELVNRLVTEDTELVEFGPYTIGVEELDKKVAIPRAFEVTTAELFGG